VNDISDRAIMAALGRQMTVAVAKGSAAASNLANLNTPGYRAQEPSFDEVLTQQVGHADAIAVTSPGHLGGTSASSIHQVRDEAGLSARRDGNNVELDRELLHMSRASADFTAAQTALAAKFRLVRYAINEGR
jgi:flagellar basal-body rod protein FlgB